MFTRFTTSVAVISVALAVTVASADWNPGDDYKMHYPQLPDLTSNGMDVLASLAVEPTTSIKFLADDFLCTESGPITDIHIWGSWLNDLFPMPPAQGTFVLALYSDIPANVGGVPYSQPGDLLWTMKFQPGDYVARQYDIAQERFYDPNINQQIGFDTVVWQYNFYIDEPLALRQEEGKIYWLAIANVDPNNDGIIDTMDLSNVLAGNNRFGWKTTQNHWNDDAVFVDVDPVFGLPADAVLPPSPGILWRELINPFTGESMDLSFVITPEPATLGLMTLGVLAVLRRR